jgi:hypothetical protein
LDASDAAAMAHMLSSDSSQAPQVIIRTTEDLLAYLQRKNPNIISFDYEGRQCIFFKDFYGIGHHF